MRLSIPPTVRSYIEGSSLWDRPFWEYGHAGVRLVEKLRDSNRHIIATRVEAAILREVATDLLYFSTEGDGTSSERRAARNLINQIDTGGRP